MKIPPEITLSTIDNFCIFYFKDSEQQKDAPPHFYLCIPLKNMSSFIVCIVTSQIRKRKRFYANTNAKAIKSLIHINNDTFSFLTKESIIDCNRAEILSKEELIKRIAPNVLFEVKEREIPEFLKREAISAIIQSPLMTPKIKKICKGI